MLKRVLFTSFLILSLMILPKTVSSSSTQPCYIICTPKECHGHYCYPCLGCCCGGWPFSCDGYACSQPYLRQKICYWNDYRCGRDMWGVCVCDSSCGAPDPACDDKGPGGSWVTGNTCEWCDSACYHYSTTCKCPNCKGNCTVGTTCYYNDACTSSGESYSSCSLCSGKKTGDCTSTGCQNYRCIKDSCGAQCDSNDDCPPGPWEPDPTNQCKERRALYRCDSNCNCVFDRYEYRDVPFDASKFTLTLSSSSGRVAKGCSVTTTAIVNVSCPPPADVRFSCENLPPGTTCSFSPTSCTPPCSSTLTISTTSATPVGTHYNLMVWARINIYGRGLPYTLTVQDCVNVTIDSSPRGSGFVSVDGSNISTPKTFCWTPGSTHTLSAYSPVSSPETPALRFIFSSWSDGGAQTHTITVPCSPTTYTASYNSQVYLAVQPNPSSGGSTSGSGWYNFGSTATIRATANTCYIFKNWTANWGGGYIGTANPTNVYMDVQAFTFAGNGNTPTQTAIFDYNNGASCGATHCSNSATHSSGDECTDITCNYRHYGTCSNGNCVYNSENCDNYDNNYCRCAIYSSKLREECRDYECVPLFGNTCSWTGDWIVKNEWTCDSTKLNTKQTCNNTDYWCCYDNGYKWQTTPCGTCSYSLTITPDFGTFRDTTKTWNINVTDSSNSYCPSPITYSISYSTSGSCDSRSTGVSTNSFSINRGSTLTNAFSVTVKRSGASCTLYLEVKDPNGNKVASGTYTVSGEVACTPGEVCKSECDGLCKRKVYVYDASCNCVYSHTEDCSPFGCSAGSCSNLCSAACGADSECDGKTAGSGCGIGGTCDNSCNCVGVGPQPLQPKFYTWLGISELSATLGQTFLVSVYVKNIGNVKDSYRFTVQTSSSNVQARVYDKEILNVYPGSTVSTKVEIKVLALSSQEEVKVIVTSSSEESEELIINLKIGSSSMSDLDIFSVLLIMGIAIIFLGKKI